MTFNPYDYSSPYPEQQPGFPNMPSSMTPLQPPVGPAQPYTAPMPVVEGGPLAGLPDQEAAVLNSADSHHTYLPGPGGAVLTYPRGRQQSVLGDMVKGALLGFGGWLLWRQMKRRRGEKGEWTSPGFRALALLVGFPIAGFLLSMIWLPETGRLLGGRVVLGFVSFTGYAIFRAAGGGRYNSRRKGSPWRRGTRRGF